MYDASEILESVFTEQNFDLMFPQQKFTARLNIIKDEILLPCNWSDKSFYGINFTNINE